MREELQSLYSVVSRELERQNGMTLPLKRDQLRRWSARKWACAELLKDIETCSEAPFVIRPLDVLEGFKRRMDAALCDVHNEHLVVAYMCADDMVESFMEEMQL